MDINISRKSLAHEPTAALLFDAFEACAQQLADAVIFFDFPIYKDLDGDTIYVQSLIASPKYGVIIFAIAAHQHPDNKVLENLEEVEAYIHSRLVKNKRLREKRHQLKFPIHLAFFKTNMLHKIQAADDLQIVSDLKDLTEWLTQLNVSNGILLEKPIFQELISTLDGSKGLIRYKARQFEDAKKSKGYFLKLLEDEIALFDNKQRHGYITPLNGPQRIRGIAGSGKTVVLAMKAAITHLKFPNAIIVYTFHTKSLYQHVQRLITRFYRQFDDKDPDWQVIKIMHGWGGRSYLGVYYDICTQHGIHALNYTDTKTQAIREKTSPFDIACKELEVAKLRQIYDFLFIDEGQDFPASFIDLCRRVTKNENIVWAYDELQNIFDTKIPTQEEVFGHNPDGTPKAEIKEDIVLYKSYRNPREILTVAHALGLGLYSDEIVQMLENKVHWEDIGYVVLEGNGQAGDKMVVQRPTTTSTLTISDNYKFNEIIKCKACNEYDEEISFIVNDIAKNLKQKLRPDDILVAIVDEKNAKYYAEDIENGLIEKKINVNNTYLDSYGILDFYLEDAVTIASGNKAKGNEAYQVYVVGCDAIFSHPDAIARNKIYTALTRAKAWVTITGIGVYAKRCQREVAQVKKYFPKLCFTYPSRDDVSIVQQDMSRRTRKKQMAQRALDDVLNTLSQEEIEAYLKVKKLEKRA